MTKRKAVYNPEADKKWRDNNKEHVKYLRYKSSARSFIRNLSKKEDLQELEEMIGIRKEDLKEV